MHVNLNLTDRLWELDRNVQSNCPTNVKHFWAFLQYCICLEKTDSLDTLFKVAMAVA